MRCILSLTFQDDARFYKSNQNAKQVLYESSKLLTIRSQNKVSDKLSSAIEDKRTRHDGYK